MILKAKEKLGDTNGDLIAEMLHMDKYNEVRKVGCCPNPKHKDDTPSCSYNPQAYEFHCFGCGYSCDIIDAHMLSNNSSFIEACEFLFEKAGIRYDFSEKGVKSRRYQYPNPKLADNKENVYEYWAKRKISKETIDYLGIQQDTGGNTLFCYYDLNDLLVNVKVRPSRAVRKGHTKIWFLPNSDSTPILYNINKINATQPLIITCGEGDCATAIECGFYNTVSIPMGDGNTHWLSECWDFLQQFDEIILVHDNDEAGRKFVKEVSARLGEYRIKIVELPSITPPGEEPHRIKDLNELLFYCGQEAVVDAIQSAKESEIPSVVDFTDVKRFDMSDTPGVKTGFIELDRILDRFYMGSTTILTGVPGSGKSSFLSTLIAQSVEQNFPVFIYSGELSNPSLKSWIDSVLAGQRNINKFESNGVVYYKIKPEAFDAINKYYKGQILLYRDGFFQSASKIMQTAEAVVRRYGIKTLIFDNMTSIDLENNDNNKYIKQDEFIRGVIEFSKKWQVCCVVVLHPKKIDCIRRMSLYDLQGVTASANLSHRVISLYRVQEKERKELGSDVIVDVLKDRFGAGGGKSVPLWYDVPSRRFYDSTETLDIRYGWDKNIYNTPLPFGCEKDEADEEVFGKIQYDG